MAAMVRFALVLLVATPALACQDVDGVRDEVVRERAEIRERHTHGLKMKRERAGC